MPYQSRAEWSTSSPVSTSPSTDGLGSLSGSRSFWRTDRSTSTGTNCVTRACEYPEIRLADQGAHFDVVDLAREVIHEPFGDMRHLLFNGQGNSGHDPSTALTTTEAKSTVAPENAAWQGRKL